MIASDHINQDILQVKVLIDLEKNFSIDEENNFKWHKSWNIPNILVRLDVLILKRLKAKVKHFRLLKIFM